ENPDQWIATFFGLKSYRYVRAGKNKFIRPNRYNQTTGAHRRILFGWPLVGYVQHITTQSQLLGRTLFRPLGKQSGHRTFSLMLKNQWRELRQKVVTLSESIPGLFIQ